jgi:hypothetical protein
LAYSLEVFFSAGQLEFFRDAEYRFFLFDGSSIEKDLEIFDRLQKGSDKAYPLFQHAPLFCDLYSGGCGPLGGGSGRGEERAL